MGHPPPLSVGVSSWSVSHPESPGALHCHLTHPSIKLRIRSTKMKFILCKLLLPKSCNWNEHAASSAVHLCHSRLPIPDGWVWQEKLRGCFLGMPWNAYTEINLHTHTLMAEQTKYCNMQHDAITWKSIDVLVARATICNCDLGKFWSYNFLLQCFLSAYFHMI